MTRRKPEETSEAVAPEETSEAAMESETSAPADEGLPSAEPAALNDLTFVTVRNHGQFGWCGTDFEAGGDSNIAPGSTGRVTLRRARMLVLDFGAEGLRGQGPFTIEE